MDSEIIQKDIPYKNSRENQISHEDCDYPKNVLLGMASPVSDKESHWTGKFASSDPKKPPIELKDFHIDSSSHIFDPQKNYVGLMVYLCGDENCFTLNGVHCKTGDIYIKESDWIVENTRKRRKRGQYIHGRLFFFSIFGRWKKKKLNFVGAGFSYQNRQWKGAKSIA
ncbi:unnamed protein product [Adineta ricciae]|uniref:Uncharacterized protein n=1 Tax=Adineta ricciae TaxID=249248 RepID=A0A815IGY7_ADIRI|nr:unnamed protein product [Adineta ricciae]